MSDEPLLRVRALLLHEKGRRCGAVAPSSGAVVTCRCLAAAAIAANAERLVTHDVPPDHVIGAGAARRRYARSCVVCRLVRLGAWDRGMSGAAVQLAAANGLSFGHALFVVAHAGLVV